MIIESYSFGDIKIDGHQYTSDLIIFSDRVIPSWWRKEGHLLHIEDLVDIVKEKPEILIIGTGYYGVMQVPHDIVKKISTSGIDVRVEKTTHAVDLYNELSKDRKVFAAFHLTC